MLFEELVPGISIEDNKTEFKGIIAEGKNDKGISIEIGWLKTIAAFANSFGGTMYIGVEDKTHTVMALDHGTADKIALMVHRLVRERLTPSVEYSMDSIPVPGTTPTRYVLSITVEKTHSTPVFVKEGGLYGLYARSFGATVQGTPDLFRDLVLLNDNSEFDSRSTNEEFSKDDYKKLFAIYEEKTGTPLTVKALASIHFLTAENMVTEGARLFKDNYDGGRTLVVATLWPESTKGSSLILASQSFEGNVFDVIDKTLEFIKSHSVNGFLKTNDTRIDVVSYPPRALFEGIVNALAHRNYFISGSQIEVNMFKDRLEITSPGSLLGTRDYRKTKDISSIRPMRRNQVICSILEYCRYMESKGSGFDKIEEDYMGKGESYRPFISTDGDSFILVLPNLQYAHGVIDKDSIPEVYADTLDLGKNDLKILSFCYAAGHNAEEVAAFLNIKASTYFRKDVLGRLVSNGFLVMDTSSRPATYRSNPGKVFLK